MDCFTVCICTGMVMERFRWRHAVRMALMFGLFQGAMPAIAWYGGLAFRDLIAAYDHWVAFGLLAIIGGKMIYESLRAEACDPRAATMGWGALLTLAVATSIDALAVGLSLSFLKTPIAGPALTFALVTVVISLLGVALGRKAGALLHSHVQLVGGLILVAIGIKILIEHLGPAAIG
ncbi:MAG: manganese efflux pump [Chloroflexi bacterium]|nr:manganese efflux pump [Chloroflexota bacterium]